MNDVSLMPFEIPIKGAPDYYINKNGEVFSSKYKNRRRLKTSINPVCGYEYISLRINGKTHQSTVHRLMALSFYGELPEGMTINHIDFNKTNNKISNLEIITMYDNMQHAKVGRRFRSGEKSPFSKITGLDVLNIVKLHSCGMKGCVLSNIYGISESMVSKIIRGKKWLYRQEFTVD